MVSEGVYLASISSLCPLALLGSLLSLHKCIVHWVEAAIQPLCLCHDIYLVIYSPFLNVLLSEDTYFPSTKALYVVTLTYIHSPLLSVLLSQDVFSSSTKALYSEWTCLLSFFVLIKMFFYSSCVRCMVQWACLSFNLTVCLLFLLLCTVWWVKMSSAHLSSPSYFA